MSTFNFRTKKTQDKYNTLIKSGHLEKECRLCSAKTIKEFLYWSIITNRFPYDRIAKVHDMIIPLRHTTESKLSIEEIDELQELKQTYLNDNYDFLLEALPSKKSIPNHFHIHLLVPQDEI